MPEQKIIVSHRQSLWYQWKLLFWMDFVLIAGWVIKAVYGDSIHIAIPVGVTILTMLVWLVAVIKSRTLTYTVYEDSIFQQRKFLSRDTSEARIPLVRSINIRQNLVERILKIGDVTFKTAGDHEDVNFLGVPDPEGIKRVVQEQQTALEARRSDD